MTFGQDKENKQQGEEELCEFYKKDIFKMYSNFCGRYF
jgi:hypothetical protein